MSRNRLALLRRLPPDVIVKRAVGLALRKPLAAWRRRIDARRSTYAEDTPAGPLVPLLNAMPLAHLDAERGWILEAAEAHRRRLFDVLGSGWQRVEHGMSCLGLDGHRYEPGPTVVADIGGAWLEDRLPSGNLEPARRIWRLVGPDYRPIDWQLDIKSGYRWSERSWSPDTPLGHLPGVDIKIPWELARLQHLPILAFAHALGRLDRDDTGAEGYRRAVLDQSLDFIATNPPRFGVNWRCTMDVAIRGANLALAIDLLRLGGGAIEAPIQEVLKASLVDHGRHIVQNLEWFPEGRANHYLANVVGLMFVAAILPRDAETDAWLAFGAQELQGETAHQFNPDGATFEASTNYHRLSGEMVLFGTALLCGLDPAKKAALREARPDALKARPRRPLGPFVEPAASHRQRLAGIAEFTRWITQPAGTVVQIGDNDSGRFFKLHPAYTPRTPAELAERYVDLARYEAPADLATCLDEETLDHRALVDGIDALLEPAHVPRSIDGAIVLALAGTGRPTDVPTRPQPIREISPCPATRSLDEASTPVHRSTEIVIPGGGLRAGLETAGFPDFGLWVFRSPRLHLVIRCGAIGHHGRGAHAHNDQLAIDLAVDGERWIADPGCFVYTALRERRDAYRSVRAHAAPLWNEREPGRLDLGDFWLGDEAQARCLAFGPDGFLGEHVGFGAVVRRWIVVTDEIIRVQDFGIPPAATQILVGRDAVRAALQPDIAYSPGYGRRLRYLP